VNEVAEQLDLQQPQASKHLKALLEAGLVRVQPVAQQRIYALDPEPVNELTLWLQSFENYWNDRFSKLDTYLEQLKGE
jgi:DNA-binding transcriptional ArsR family regulator